MEATVEKAIQQILTDYRDLDPPLVAYQHALDERGLRIWLAFDTAYAVERAEANGHLDRLRTDLIDLLEEMGFPAKADIYFVARDELKDPHDGND